MRVFERISSVSRPQINALNEQATAEPLLRFLYNTHLREFLFGTTTYCFRFTAREVQCIWNIQINLVLYNIVGVFIIFN